MGGKFIPRIYHINYMYSIVKYMIGSEIFNGNMIWYGFQKYWIYEWGVFWKSQRYVCTQQYGTPPPREEEVPKYIENRWDLHRKTIYIIDSCAMGHLVVVTV